MGIVFSLICIVLFFFGRRAREGKEKRVYEVLCFLGAMLWVFAFFKEQGDHVGASLSGMISIFMR